MNLIPELTKAQCSLVGAWGPAIKDALAESTLFQVSTHIKHLLSVIVACTTDWYYTIQVRALDWEIGGPIQDVEVLYVYHPDESAVPGAMPFASFSYPSFVGAITRCPARK